MIQDYFRIALKNLRHRGIRSWLTLLGIFIGVTAVIALISLGSGLKLAVSSQFGISSTEVLSIEAGGLNYGPPGSGAVKPLTVLDLDAINKLPSVKRAIRRNIVSLKVDFNSIQQIKYSMQIPNGQDRAFAYSTVGLSPEKGRMLTDADTSKIMLGYNFISDSSSGFSKGVEIGDKLTINGKKLEVAGIVQKKGSFIFDNVIYMNEKQLEEFMPNKDNIDVIVVQAQSKDTLNKTKEDIEKLLRQRRNVKVGEEDFKVQTPQSMLGTVNSILTGVQIFIVIIAFISILVGAVGIVNTMTTSVLERRKEIGIMKAIGARNSQVFLQFFIEAGLLGLIGGISGSIFGTAIGYFGTVAIGSFVGGSLNPNVDFMLIGLTLVGSFIVGAVAGIVPARNAANQNPVEVLRG